MQRLIPAASWSFDFAALHINKGSEGPVQLVALMNVVRCKLVFALWMYCQEFKAEHPYYKPLQSSIPAIPQSP